MHKNTRIASHQSNIGNITMDIFSVDELVNTSTRCWFAWFISLHLGTYSIMYVSPFWLCLATIGLLLSVRKIVGMIRRSFDSQLAA